MGGGGGGIDFWITGIGLEKHGMWSLKSRFGFQIILNHETLISGSFEFYRITKRCRTESI